MPIVSHRQIVYHLHHFSDTFFNFYGSLHPPVGNSSVFATKVDSSMRRGNIPTKSALNSLLYSLSFESKRKNILVVAISPGMVNTTPGMKLPGAIEIEESVTKMMQVIDDLTMADNGHFIDYEDGRQLAW
jgi:NAD(P)-dependent dehydrogenase (short-subunit alcohol dehydrogenase family)